MKEKKVKRNEKKKKMKQKKKKKEKEEAEVKEKKKNEKLHSLEKMANKAKQPCSDLAIFDEDFPDNVSLSELCECGRCVKRMNKHKPIPTQARGPFPKTDYMSTYEAVQNPRPRSSKRPPATARDTRPVPMYFTTNQKESFKNLGPIERAQPIVHVELEPILRQNSRRELIHREPATFDGTTTNRQHFKRWVPQPSLTFGELPSFTGSILFPEKENVPLSTMRQSFAGTYVPPAAQIRNADANIKLEGEHQFGTSYSSTYQQIDGDHRARQHVQKDTTPLSVRRGAFKGVTQTMSDFPGYHGNQPRPPKAVAPPEPKIDLRFNNKRSFTTENRSIYRGHDINNHPAPVSCKKDEGEYQPPEIKFETETSQKKDKGIALYIRFKFGDFHENRPYFPPKDKFNAQSVTQTSFQGQMAPPVRSFKPENKPIAKSGEVNFSTVYQSEFQKKEARMCRAKMYLIQQELRRRKLERQAEQQQTAKSAPHQKVAA
ncbi:stabilizer of axonemal microtubules 1-like [Elysia marginata]|uniref:Stabilizer of axonemal microtubules 1-like n=1 Tax=Elysia marginata TaxID=1093978 RepID=A0AAV4FG33_9GAST|nr:stabilizer of axonemal microtubules 1-like [Elysia marginata]